jgi:acyl-coenzyme A thioesterase PaaI-like protein
MIDLHNLSKDLSDILKKKFKNQLNDLQIPPTAFTTMQGEMLEYDVDRGYVKIMFPVLDTLLNQFKNMQGGMIAAAIDNTLGPLSMLVAPPNFTRQLEIKYRKPIPLSTESIFVEGYLEGVNKRQVFFSAKVLDKQNTVMASAKAIHWLINENDG